MKRALICTFKDRCFEERLFHLCCIQIANSKGISFLKHKIFNKNLEYKEKAEIVMFLKKFLVKMPSVIRFALRNCYYIKETMYLVTHFAIRCT